METSSTVFFEFASELENLVYSWHRFLHVRTCSAVDTCTCIYMYITSHKTLIYSTLLPSVLNEGSILLMCVCTCLSRLGM